MLAKLMYSHSIVSFLLSTQERFALCGCNHRFLTLTSDNRIMAVSEKATDKEIMTVSSYFK